MKMHIVSLTMVLFVGVSNIATAHQQSDTYKPLGGQGGIEEQIKLLADGSGGDAVRSPLKGESGSVIQTEGMDGPPATRRNIWLLEIAKGGGGTNRVNILVTGSQHADEWTAYFVVLESGKFILDQKPDESWAAGDTRFDHFRLFKEMNVKLLMDNANIFLIPVMNPEGYYYSHDRGESGDPNWRKNRRDTNTDPDGNGEYWGGNFIPGADLNRNYPVTKATYDWGYVGQRLFNGVMEKVRSSRWEIDNNYCGRPREGSWATGPFHPIVEKETEAIIVLSKATTFSCHIDVHTSGGIVGWIEGPEITINLRPNGDLKDEDVLKILATKSASLIEDPSGGKYDAKVGPYPTSGDILQWQYENTSNKALSFLIEVAKGRNHHPNNPDTHAKKVLPGILFKMFATVDKSFSSKPSAKFRKPD